MQCGLCEADLHARHASPSESVPEACHGQTQGGSESPWTSQCSASSEVPSIFLPFWQCISPKTSQRRALSLLGVVPHSPTPHQRAAWPASPMIFRNDFMTGWLTSVLNSGHLCRLLPHLRVKYWTELLLLFHKEKSILTNEINLFKPD